MTHKFNKEEYFQKNKVVSGISYIIFNVIKQKGGIEK